MKVKNTSGYICFYWYDNCHLYVPDEVLIFYRIKLLYNPL